MGSVAEKGLDFSNYFWPSGKEPVSTGGCRFFKTLAGDPAFIFLSSIFLSFLDRRKRDAFPSDVDPLQTVESCVAEQPAGMIFKPGEGRPNSS